MDTYYYGTGRVIDALDFYLDSVQPPSKLGVGMSVWQATPDQDGFIARCAQPVGAGPPAAEPPPRRRFHALRRSGVTEVDMFAMPLNSSWIPWLRKWKTDARGCPNSGVLSAWSYNGGTCF